MAKDKGQKGRHYLVSEATVRKLFIGGGATAVIILVGLLLAMSLRPQGRYITPDRTQYRRNLADTASQLGRHAPSQEDTAYAVIPIDRAIELMADEGLASVEAMLRGQAAPPAPSEDMDTADTPSSDAEGVLTAGEQPYQANCSGCHQANGQGIPGAFPPLAGHAPELYAADRSYPVNVLLYGLRGNIHVAGQNYNGVMPAWRQLSNEQLASILNYIMTAWGNADRLPGDFTPYSAEDFSSQRGQGLNAGDVYDLRQAAGLD